jgi:hypothetical protein
MPGHELRCQNRMHGIWIPPHTVEFKCNDRFCGAVAGEVVVLHRFNVKTQEMTTRKFKPVDARKEVKEAHATDDHSAALRLA